MPHIKFLFAIITVVVLELLAAGYMLANGISSVFIWISVALTLGFLALLGSFFK